MKIEWKTCGKIGISIFLLYLAIYYWAGVSSFLGRLLASLVPIFSGFIIAFIIGILLEFYDRSLFKKTKSAMRVVTERLERAEARVNIAETQSKEINEKVQALTKSNEVSEMRLSRITERLKEAQANTKLTEEVERVNNELVLSKDKTMMLESALSSEKEKCNKLAK